MLLRTVHSIHICHVFVYVFSKITGRVHNENVNIMFHIYHHHGPFHKAFDIWRWKVLSKHMNIYNAFYFIFSILDIFFSFSFWTIRTFVHRIFVCVGVQCATINYLDCSKIILKTILCRRTLHRIFCSSWFYCLWWDFFSLHFQNQFLSFQKITTFVLWWTIHENL